jgi:hypothetical protein
MLPSFGTCAKAQMRPPAEAAKARCIDANTVAIQSDTALQKAGNYLNCYQVHPAGQHSADISVAGFPSIPARIGAASGNGEKLDALFG